MADDLRASLRVPMWCPVCELVMKGDKSSASYYQWGCCIDCQIDFVETREDRWRAGWRPNRGEVDRILQKREGKPIEDIRWAK